MAQSDIKCIHCGLPADNPVIYKDDSGKKLIFCCNGCFGAYSLIHDSGLDNYYQYRDKKSNKPKRTDFNYLDSDSFQKEFVKTDGNIKEATLNIDGIHCSACVWLNEKVLEKLDGVISVDLSYATHKARVKWDSKKVSLSRIADTISAIGYFPSPVKQNETSDESHTLLFRAGVAGIGFEIIMMLSLGLYAGYFQGIDSADRYSITVASLLIATFVIAVSGLSIIKSAYIGIKNGAFGMDVPIAIGVVAIYLYSIYATFDNKETYFDSLSGLLFFILLGRYLSAYLNKRLSEKVDNLYKKRVRFATKITENGESVISFSDIKKGDLLKVKPQQTVPADGVIERGGSYFDESLLTGEPMPIKKEKGDLIISGTVNRTGEVLMRATKDADKSIVAGLINLVENSLSAKPSIELMADKVSQYFVPSVIFLTLITFIIYYLSGYDFNRSIVVAVSVLVITCPCALGLATPLADLAGTIASIEKGIYVKSPEIFEKMSKITDLLFDKTGTLSSTDLKISDILTTDREKLLNMAAMLEEGSAHPVGELLRKAAYMREKFDGQIEDVDGGRIAYNKNRRYAIGSRSLMEKEGIKIFHEQNRWAEKNRKNGKSVVWVASGSEVIGLIAIEEKIRADSFELIAKLRKQFDISLLTGDAKESASKLAKKVGISNIYAELTPVDKEKIVSSFQASGKKVMMVGDGINDLIAISKADIGVAMGKSELSSPADAIIINDRIGSLFELFRISTKTATIIKENLMLSAVYNIIAIPVAMAGLVNPLIAALSMSASSIIVTLNSFRIAKTVPVSGKLVTAPAL